MSRTRSRKQHRKPSNAKHSIVKTGKTLNVKSAGNSYGKRARRLV